MTDSASCWMLTELRYKQAQHDEATDYCYHSAGQCSGEEVFIDFRVRVQVFQLVKHPVRCKCA